MNEIEYGSTISKHLKVISDHVGQRLLLPSVWRLLFLHFIAKELSVICLSKSEFPEQIKNSMLFYFYFFTFHYMGISYESILIISHLL